jgi:exonuclease SbcC
MIIKSLKLHYYRRFENLQLEFPENVVGFLGRNGSGKSTIIEAIGWALYGNRIVRTDKQDIRSQFAQNDQTCSVELLYLFGGHEYKVVRKLRGKNAISEAAVYRGGQSEPEAVQDRGVNEFIEKLLKLDYRSFFATVFAKQKDLAALSSMQPEERRQRINRLINIDLIDQSRELVRRDRNDKLKYVSGMKAALKDVDALKLQEEELVKKQQEREQAKSELERLKERREKALAKSKKVFDSISRLRDRDMEYQAMIGKLEARINENKGVLARIEEELIRIGEAEKELESLARDLSDFDVIKAEKERLDEDAARMAKLEGLKREKEVVLASNRREQEREKELAAKSADLEKWQQELQGVDADEEELEDALKSALEEIKKYHSEQEVSRNRGLELRKKYDQIIELGPESPCPFCTQKLGNHYDKVSKELQDNLAKERKLFAKAQRNEQEAQEKKRKIEVNVKETRAKKENLLKQLSAATEAQTHHQRCLEAMQNYQLQLQTIEKQIQHIGEVDYEKVRHLEMNKKYQFMLELKQKSVQLEERVNRRSSVTEEKARVNRVIVDLTADLQENNERRIQLGYDEEKYLSMKSEIEEKTKAENAIKDELGAVREQLAGIAKELSGIKTEIVDQEDKRQQITDAEDEIAYLDALDLHFGHFRRDLANRIRPFIAHRASELLQLTTQSRYSLLDLDQDYNIRIYDGPVAHPIERFSGGEQDLANLCLRIAISQVIAERSGGAPINFIVLDEIFGSQDETRRELILSALHELSSQFRQIFIITHIETIKDVLPVVIDVCEQDEQRSVARIV